MKQPYVFSLPNELLLIVFGLLVELDPLGEIAFEDEDEDVSDTTSSFASDDADETYSYASRSDLCHGYSLGFMRVTHVCHFWREFALGVPGLWTTIPLGLCSDWVDALVQRSGGMPLDVHITFDADHAHINRSIARIGESHIRRIYSESMDFDALWLLSKFGFLRLEEIDSIYNTCPPTRSMNGPALRKLDLSLAPGSVSLPSLSQAGGLCEHLTELTLRTTAITIIPASNSWINIISNLTVLHLQLVTFSFNAYDASVVVELPHLQELSIVETGASCGEFLPRFSIPSFARCNQHFMKPMDTLQTARLLESLPYYQAIENVFQSRPLSLLAVTHSAFVTLDDRFSVISAHGWRDVPNGTDGAPYFKIEGERSLAHDADVAQVLEPQETYSFAGFVPAFLCRPYFGTLAMLALDIDPRLESASTVVWRETLYPMTQLRHLRVSSPCSERKTPLNILQAVLRAGPEDDVVVPLLDSLTLVDWDPDMDEQGRRIVTIECHNEASSDVPGAVVRAIIEDRAGVLRTVYLKSWRRDYSLEWQPWMKELRGVSIVYEKQYLPLDHVHATEDMDQGYDIEESDVSEVEVY